MPNPVTVRSGSPIIPCLEVRHGRMTEPSGMPGLADPRDPVEIARSYRQAGIEKLIVDIVDPWEWFQEFAPLVGRLADAVPALWVVVADGYVPSLSSADALFGAGAVAIGLSTTTVRNPDTMREVAARHGPERVLGIMNVRRVGDDRWNVFVEGGGRKTGLDAVTWAGVLTEDLGAGLVHPNSLDGEKAGTGYDLPLCRAVADITDVPVVIGGGCATREHLYEGLVHGRATYTVVNKATHSGAMAVGAAHDYLRRRGLM
ncbi:HisA/HisF-related TIM barrel protein [Actinomadura terrae]|uniref:HisA/HisF-related TIM barrel protein n=1 Tax=Actinomadura terrae TaxID=604353 RepID=UPI001FA773C9|nr:HisA/HisF-related TIM barrel protein [Actinomadura terrae]